MASVEPPKQPSEAASKGKTPWKERTATVNFHLTPAEKEEYLKMLEKAGFSNGQEAFFTWLRSQRANTFLTETQSKYLDARNHAALLANKLGKRKMRLLGVKWKLLGGKADGSNHDEMFPVLMDALLDKIPGLGLTDLILFKQYCASYHEVRLLEADVRKGARVKTSPPPPP